MDDAMKRCAVDWATFSPTKDAQVDAVVSTLRKLGWKVTDRHTSKESGLTSLTKGSWNLQVTHRTHEGGDYLSLLALRDSQACEEAAGRAG